MRFRAGQDSRLVERKASTGDGRADDSGHKSGSQHEDAMASGLARHSFHREMSIETCT